MVLLLIISLNQIDLNRAELKDFYKLPVDSLTARAIYEYRELYGSFKSVYEILRVPGIDQNKFETIKPFVKIANPFPPRSEWGSIIAEQKKLASEEPPSKGAIDEWEELLYSPTNINKAKFDDLVMIDRMTPIDANAILRAQQQRVIRSARDLRQVNGLSYYSYVSLRKYVQYTDSTDRKFHGSVRIKIENGNRLDIGEDENIATRISYLEQAKNEIDNTIFDLKNFYGWSDNDCEKLRNEIDTSLYTLRRIKPEPSYSLRLKGNYERRLRLGILYHPKDGYKKGYVGIGDVGPVYRFYLGNYCIVWGEGLMVDNTDEYRARIFSRSTGIFGDLTENRNFTFTGFAGSFILHMPGEIGDFKPSLFYSLNQCDAILNPDGTVWRRIDNKYNLTCFKNQLNEQVLGLNLSFAPLNKINPGTYIAIEGMVIDYPEQKINPDPKWIDVPLDNYDPWFYPEITRLSSSSKRCFYGGGFLLPFKNLFFSSEYVAQRDTTYDRAFAYVLKSRLQYDYFYLNLLYRYYHPDYDNPFHRGFSEYRRFEDTPFEKPYALLNPEFTSLYDDPAPKPEQGVYIETRYQITRNITLSRAYLDIFQNLCHNLNNLRGYFEFEGQPIFPVRIRYSEKYIQKYLARPVQNTQSKTIESSIKILFYLSNFDNLGFEYRTGNVFLTPTEGDNEELSGGFLNLSFERNFLTGFSVEGGLAIWKTDGMSQWIFEDTGIDFLSNKGIKFYIVTSQKIGNLLVRFKIRKKETVIEHNGLYNNPDIYYPDLPGVRVNDFINYENSISVNLQLYYLF
jgi:DNA uptake protein ComE-like DNA-binding protein|uniref:Helix-hairpin-helix domain-containing protein n=1 Tax=candidate division WOR-3 bacterium TaxID=2052148 RepID=A0A7V3RJ37_UNCW3